MFVCISRASAILPTVFTNQSARLKGTITRAAVYVFVRGTDIWVCPKSLYQEPDVTSTFILLQHRRYKRRSPGHSLFGHTHMAYIINKFDTDVIKARHSMRRLPPSSSGMCNCVCEAFCSHSQLPNWFIILIRHTVCSRLGRLPSKRLLVWKPSRKRSRKRQCIMFFAIVVQVLFSQRSLTTIEGHDNRRVKRRCLCCFRICTNFDCRRTKN